MKRRLLDLEINRLRSVIPSMKKRTAEYYFATGKLRDLVLERMRRDQNAKQRKKMAA